jgi:hypothetical protein
MWSVETIGGSNFSQAVTENAFSGILIGSISGNQSKKERNTVEKSASAPPPTTSGRYSESGDRK